MSKIINKITLTIVSFYIVYLGILPIIINNTAEIVCKNISHNTDYKISVNTPHTSFSILPYANLSAKEISVKYGINELELKNFKLRIRLLPLFSGKIHLNSISADNLKLTTNLKEDAQLDKDFFDKLESTKILCDSIKINHFDTYLYKKEIKTPIIYKGDNLVLQVKNRYVKLQLNSTLEADNKISQADINMYFPKNNDIKKTICDIDVSNFNLTPFGVYFKHYLPNDLIKIEGNVQVHANKDELVTELKNCTAVMKDPASTIKFPDSMQIRSKFNIKRDRIRFESAEILAKNINIAFNGTIYNYFGKTMPTLDMNIQINPTRVEDIVNMLPAFKVEEIDIHKLKKYKFYGDTIGHLAIKGRLPEPDINGDIYISNGILTKPIPNTTKGATIKLELGGKYVNFDVFVPAGNNEKVWVKGSQELYNIKYSDLTVKSTPSVDLHVAETVVNPLHEILNFIIGPVPILDIYGKGNIDIQVKGNRKNPHVWGVFNTKDAIVSFNEIPDLILKNADSVLTFNDQDAIFTNKTGTVNGKDFKINGTCNLFGKFDFDTSSQNQPTADLYQALKTSTMIPDVQKLLPKLDKINGTTDLNVKIYGTVKDISDLKINQNAFAKGEITIKDNNFTLQNMNIDKTNGTVKFDGLNADAELSAIIANAPARIKAKIKNNIGDVDIDIPKLNPNLLIPQKNIQNILPLISVNAKYKGDVENIEYEKVNLNAKVLESLPDSCIKYLSGEVTAANNKFLIKNLSGYIESQNNSFQADLKIDSAFSDKPLTSGNIKLKTPDLSLYNNIFMSEILPKNIKNYLKDFELQKGKVDLNLRITNNKINAYSDLSGVSFNYIPLDLPINIINGNLLVKNNNLILNKINILADKMPVLIDGEIKDITQKQQFNIYLNTKPQQEFIDKYINKNQIYPIKIKGDIVCSAKARGVKNDFDLTSNLNMSKDSSIYHYGATIGDIENSIVLDFNTNITNGNTLKIREFTYDKLIPSQSGRQTRLSMLKAWGGVEILKEDLSFKDLRIKTFNPADARIFNIIFRKPNIKQGQFTSDLKLNGKLSNPRVTGNFHIFETNIPFLDTTMKNIVLSFKDRTIDFSSKGEVLGNEIVFNGVMKNKLTKPYQIEKADFYTKDLNLNYIVEKIKLSEVDSISTFESIEGMDLADLVFKDFKLKADRIQLRNIDASGFEANMNMDKNGLLDIENFKFYIAQGVLNGKYSYNLKNNDMNLNLNAKEINANDLSWALFDLKNQIYGDMTGTVALSCNGTHFENCMQTLNGDAVFNVKDGRMPKLGSLEYLLKAGNLVKGGLTGISINSVIDIITPLKTGEFSDIYGKIGIKDGVARYIDISTAGKTLNLYITGTYNFATSIADMEVFGTLAKKISTMFGPIGNVSINTLFNVIPGIDLTKDSLVLEKINKIPGIELSSKDFRKFIADIKGNINGDDYVTSFKWIE